MVDFRSRAFFRARPKTIDKTKRATMSQRKLHAEQRRRDVFSVAVVIAAATTVTGNTRVTEFYRRRLTFIIRLFSRHYRNRTTFAAIDGGYLTGKGYQRSEIPYNGIRFSIYDVHIDKHT